MRRHWRLLAEAGWVLAFCRVTAWVWPRAAVRRIARRPAPQQHAVSGPDFPRLVGWAVGAWGARASFFTCLVQAGAAHVMLTRRGYASAVRLGIKPGPTSANDRRVRAHAWVECEGVVVVGNLDDLAGYATLSAAGEAGRSLAWND